jgi:hypothetical protein
MDGVDNDRTHQRDDLSNCTYLEDCPIFARIHNQELRTMWILEYCKGGESPSCARFKLKKQGRTVPTDLLPDGSTIDERPHE